MAMNNMVLIVVISVIVTFVLYGMKMLYQVSRLRLECPKIKLAEYVDGHMIGRP